MRAPPLAELLKLDDTAFRTLFTKSPVKRIHRDRFIRNALIAAGNSGDIALVDDAIRLLDDPDPVVRGAAVWALAQLLPPEQFESRARHALLSETDESVREEWQNALTSSLAAC